MSTVDQWRARARKYLTSAAALIQIGDYESSISRSYYAMFYMARAALRTRQIAPRSHNGVLTLFAEHFVKTGHISQEDYTAFRNAFDQRSLAEYAPDAAFTVSQAEQNLIKARAFVAHVEAMLSG